MDNIRLMIVEDNDELRGFMAQYFSRQQDITVVGEAANGLNDTFLTFGGVSGSVICIRAVFIRSRHLKNSGHTGQDMFS